MALIPTQATLTVGGRVFTDLANLIVLYGYADTVSRATLRKMGDQSGAGYQVPVGKTLKVYAMKTVSSDTGGSSVQVAQVDADIGFASATALTNPIYFGTESSTLTSANVMINPPGVGSTHEVSGHPLGSVAAGKYVGMDTAGTGSSLFVYGYLE